MYVKYSESRFMWSHFKKNHIKRLLLYLFLCVPLLFNLTSSLFKPVENFPCTLINTHFFLSSSLYLFFHLSLSHTHTNIHTYIHTSLSVSHTHSLTFFFLSLSRYTHTQAQNTHIHTHTLSLSLCVNVLLQVFSFLKKYFYWFFLQVGMLEKKQVTNWRRNNKFWQS